MGMAAVGAGLLIAPMVWSWSGLRHPQSGLFPAVRAGGASDPLGGVGTGGPFGGVGVTEPALGWLEQQRSGETWVLGMQSAMVAEQPIIDGHDVVALGGFSGSDKSAGLGRVAAAVEAGQLRFIMSGQSFGPFDAGGRGSVWAAVPMVCVEVPASKWGASGGSGIYDCRGAAAALRVAEASTVAPVTPPPQPQRDPDTSPGSVNPTAPAPVPGTDPRPGSGPGGPPGGQPPPEIVECFASYGIEVDPTKAPDFEDPKVVAAIQACIGDVGPPPGV